MRPVISHSERSSRNRREVEEEKEGVANERRVESSFIEAAVAAFVFSSVKHYIWKDMHVIVCMCKSIWIY